MISDDPVDIKAMTKAAQDPQLIILSDWDHLPSDEYMKVMAETGYDILLVILIQFTSNLLIQLVAQIAFSLMARDRFTARIQRNSHFFNRRRSEPWLTRL